MGFLDGSDYSAFLGNTSLWQNNMWEKTYNFNRIYATERVYLFKSTYESTTKSQSAKKVRRAIFCRARTPHPSMSEFLRKKRAFGAIY